MSQTAKAVGSAVDHTADGVGGRKMRCVALALGPARPDIKDADAPDLYGAVVAQVSRISGIYCENAFNLPSETPVEIWVIDSDTEYSPPKNGSAGIILRSSASGTTDAGEGVPEGWLVLDKPVRLGKLVESVQRLSMNLDRDAVIHIPGYRVSPAQRQLIDAETGALTQLTDKECEILSFLAQYPDESIDRETLLSAVWGYDGEITTHTLETHIYRLRQKIESDDSAPPVLLTDAQGYRLRLAED